MNNYTYEEIFVGMEEAFDVEVTEMMMESFAGITGDINPMHLDDNYAIQKGYNSKIVYGMLTASFFSTLAGVYLPGEFCLFLQCDAKFNRPVYIGDILVVSGKVIEKKTIPFNQIVVKGVIRNQYNAIVSTAKLLLGVTM